MPRRPRIGPYLVDAELGRGGMGAVYRARHAETGGAYALKVAFAPVDDERARRRFARFQREVELLARIEPHPGVVKIHACGIDGGRPWCAMELVAGESLAAALRRGPLSPRRAAEAAREVAEAIVHVHRHDVVHRDLKPENVLLEAESGRARVVDFGLAYDAFSEQLTRTGELLGTPAYMAPEQVARTGTASGERASQIGPATDVYGLGAVLYAALTGHAPFEAPTGMAILHMLVGQPPPEPRRHVPDIPPDLEAVCLRALEKEPGKRYATAQAFAEDLARFLGGEPTLARPMGPVARVVRRVVPTDPARRRRVLLAGGLALLAALALGGGGAALVARARAEAERRGRIAGLERELDEAFDAACGGELAALDLAGAQIEQLRALGSDDPSLGARGEIVAGLHALAEGDPIAIRTIRLDAAPWLAHREAIVNVLLGAGRPAELAIILEREPALLEREGVVERMATALAEGSVTPTREMTELVDAALDRRAGEGREEARRAAGLRAGLLAARLEAMLAGGEQGEEQTRELDRILPRLLSALQRGGPPPHLAPAAAERLVALAAGDPSGMDLGAIRTLGLIAEATFTLMPQGDPRAERIVRGLEQDLTLAMVANERMTRRRAFEIGLMLQRLGRLPVKLYQLEAAAPETPELRGMADRLVRRSPIAPQDAADLCTITMMLLERAARLRAAENEEEEESERWAAVILEHWPLVVALVDAERRQEDLPGWVLVKLGEVIERAVVCKVGEPPETEARVELLARAVSLLVGEVERDAGAALRGGLDELFVVGWERASATRRQRIELCMCVGSWLMERTERGMSPVAEQVLLAGLELGERLRPGSEDRGLYRGFYQLGNIAIDVDRGVEKLVKVDPGVDEPCEHGERIERLARAVARAVPESRVPDTIRARHHIAHGRNERAAELLQAAVDHVRDTERFRGQELWYAIKTQVELLFAMGMKDQARAAIEQDAGPNFKLFYHYGQRAELWDLFGETERAAADRAEQDRRLAEQRPR